jgi:hypothetical protein
MYDMYPDWGPTKHQQNDAASEALQTALDRRDNGGQGPDDS